MTKKRATAAVLRTTSSFAMWMIRAATFCTGLLAMLALVVVLATLMPAMVVATATPAFAASATHDPRKRFAGGEYRVRGTRRTLPRPWSRFVIVDQDTDESGRR
jgi:poly(3-hydroxybutyrate) depolymerase